MLNSYKMVKIATLVLGCIGSMCIAGTGAGSFITKPEVRLFVDEMVVKHDFNGIDLINILSHAKRRQRVIDAISKPAESKPWFEYRRIFLTPERIRAGAHFWEVNREALLRAEREYGVAQEIVVAILGVETRYGQNTGQHRVLDSLMTLAFAYSERRAFFRGELEQYLLLAREERLDPLVINGSYAGAMGVPQFIASSYRRYAVDFDTDGRRDLLNNTVDAIGSVANYFHRHGWQPGRAVAARARITGNRYKALLRRDVKPKTSIKQMQQYGVNLAGDITGDTGDVPLASLIELRAEKGSEYWVGWYNFYVITRYNHSPLYAMAVYQLSREIRAWRELDVARVMRGEGAEGSER